MTVFENQRDYWDQVAAMKTFTHPLDHDLLRRLVQKTARILDYGCGQGRVSKELIDSGFENVLGVDFSASMIQQARDRVPNVRFEVLGDTGINLQPSSVDCIILFAVLTCIADDRAQADAAHEMVQALRPGGIIYLSDVALQKDARAISRYQKDVQRTGRYGDFFTEDGGLMRHHNEESVLKLFPGFRRLLSKEVEVFTMNGHRSTCFQWVIEKAA